MDMRIPDEVPGDLELAGEINRIGSLPRHNKLLSLARSHFVSAQRIEPFGDLHCRWQLVGVERIAPLTCERHGKMELDSCSSSRRRAELPS